MGIDMKAGLLAGMCSFMAGLGCGGAPNPAATAPSGPSASPSSAPGGEPQPAASPAPEVATAEPGGAGQVEQKPEPPAPPKGPPLDEGATVLVVGDSFSQSLGVGLKPILKAQGVRVVIKGQKATFIPEWAGTKMGMALAVMQYKPELVVIVLGGNELGIKDPTIRASRIRRVVGNAKDRPCVWVAPALWEFGDPHGLLEVIRENSKPCRYYDSNTLAGELPRGGDKIHPDIHGQKKWAEALLAWLVVERDRNSDGFALKPRPEGE